jgi:hypothetical protein
VGVERHGKGGLSFVDLSVITARMAVMAVTVPASATGSGVDSSTTRSGGELGGADVDIALASASA